MYLTRGGNVHLPTGSLRAAGNDGYYWASSAYPSSRYAFSLFSSSTYVIPSSYGHRWYGFTVRKA